VVRVQYRRLGAALTEHYEAEEESGPLALSTIEDGFGIVVLDRRSAAARAHRKAGWLGATAVVVLLAAGVGAWLYFKPRLANAREVARLDTQAHAFLEEPTGSNAATSVRLFEQAVAIDSRDAPGWSGLADALIVPGSSTDLSRTDALAKAREAAKKAIGLNPGIGQPHAVMGYVKLFQDADWTGAEAEFQRAIQLDPSAPKTHSMYAQGLMSRGRFDEAIAQAKLAASLAPAGTLPTVDLAEILTTARRYDEGIAEARRALQQMPSSPSAHLALAIALSAAGHYDESIPEYRAVILMGHSLYATAWLGYAYGASGDKVAAQSMLNSLNQAFVEMATTHWYYRALIYAGMGDNGSALTCLELGAEDHENDLTFIGVEPAFDRLHSEPRFVALKKRFGLP
jgi:tetratricopeptide (TPR) repeat protein